MNFFKKLFGKKASTSADLEAQVADQVNAYLSRATEFRFSGQYELAIKECNKALSLHPTNSVAYHIRSLCRYSVGDQEGAFGDWKRYQSLREVK